jgi:Spy/CpxP family protein refolding chaperone
MSNTENTRQENENPAEVPSKKEIKKSGKLKFIIPLIVFALLFTAICGIVMAKKKFHDGPEGFLFGRIVEKLNLTDNQKAQVEKIRDEIRAKMESRKDTRGNMMEEFANEFKKDNLDRSKLIELDQKREQNKQEMKDFMMDKLVEFHNLLTPEQRNKAVELMQDMKNKFHDKSRHDKDKQNRDQKNTDKD